jgi:hypothetical protein
MATKKLSERKAFASGIVLSGNYMSNPGVNGECELAILQKTTKTEIWSWGDEWGGECLVVLPPQSTWRDWVATVAKDERFASTVIVEEVVWRGVSDEIGGLLAWAWCEDEDVRCAIEIILKLDEQSINGLARNWSSAIPFAANLWREMYEEDVVPYDLPDRIALTRKTASGLEAEIRAVVKAIIDKRERAEQERRDKLAPFSESIERIMSNWQKTHPNAYLPKLGTVPNPTVSLVRSYMEDYVVQQGSVPTGKHTIPGGKGWMGRVVASFEVDFSELDK